MGLCVLRVSDIVRIGINLNSTGGGLVVMIHIDKPWGYEEIIENNAHYVIKLLFFKCGECCSLQYHREKHETIYVLDGILSVLYGDIESELTEITLTNNEFIVIPPMKIHRSYGVTDCLCLESSTTQLDDVVRLQDNYGRSS